MKSGREPLPSVGPRWWRGERSQREVALDLFEYRAEQLGLVFEVVVEHPAGTHA